MNRWEKLRLDLLRSLYESYMEEHTAWVDFEGTDEHARKDILREADYLVERGLVRRENGYQLTADGRDYVESSLRLNSDKLRPRFIR